MLSIVLSHPLNRRIMEYKGKSNITYEPFRAAYTGTLMTFNAQDGRTYSLHQPGIRIEKGQHFMLAIDRQTLNCRLIAVVAPDPRMHS